MTANSSYFSGHAQADFEPHVTERRLVSPDGVWMLEVDQPPGDFPDPPIAELVLHQDLGRISGRCDFGAGRFVMHPGTMGLVPPMTAADIVCYNHHQIRVLAIPAARIAGWMQDDAAQGSGAVDLGPLHAASFKNPLIEQLLDRLWHGPDIGTRAGRLLSDAATITLWAELLRHARLPAPRLSRGGLATWQVRRCTEYLAAHVTENVGLQELAALVGLSPFHFARAFKQSTGVPPHRYQLNLRIERAKTLLELTEASVTDIAFSVGYESTQALSRMFRREVGVSPSDYRRHRGGGAT
jgi:AraC family transcriptional regulator